MDLVRTKPTLGKTELEDPERELQDQEGIRRIQFDWMHCANPDCLQLVVRGRNSHTTYSGGMPELHTESWLVHPQHRVRPVDPLVPKDLARDFAEAAAILDKSHRMSAVLARRILADVLEGYAGLTQFSLTARINQFVADESRPYELRDNLHYLREIGDFSAHTQTDKQSEGAVDDQLTSIEIGLDEAEWTLDVVERLFDYFIVAPERDRRLRAGMDEKLAKAGRKPIEPLSRDSELQSKADGEGSA